MVPVHLPVTSRGRYFCFCASVPRRRIASIAPWVSSDTREKPKLAPFHISMTAASTSLGRPWPPYSAPKRNPFHPASTNCRQAAWKPSGMATCPSFHLGPSTSPARSSGAQTPPANFAASSSTELTRSGVASSQPARVATVSRSASSSMANCMSLTGALYVLIACSSRALMNLLVLVQKPVNDWRDVVRLRHQKHVAVVDHVQLGAPNERRQDPGVDEWHDRIVQAVHDERGLRQQPQPGKTGPSGGRDQLIEVAAVARRP